MERTQWLACVASPGQFSNEFAVVARDHAEDAFSLFAPRDLVRCSRPPAAAEKVPAWLLVEVLDHSNDLVLVRLPGETLESGPTVAVRIQQLQKSVEPVCA